MSLTQFANVSPHGRKVESQNGKFLFSCVPDSSSPLRSRNIVVQHCDPNGLDILTTAFHTLLVSVLSTWSPEHTLSQTQFINFVKSVLDSLPSSSSQQSSSCAATLGDHLVDMIWSVDAALDEVLSDPKFNPNAADSDPEVVSKAQASKQSAESDKESLQVIVKRLLVRVTTLPLSLWLIIL